MSALHRQFKTDEKLEKEGILIQYGFVDGEDGKPDETKPICFRIARAGGANQAYNKTVAHKVKPYRRQIQTETIDDKVAEKLMMEAFVEKALLGWENVQDSTGNFISFSKENAIKLFVDLPELYKDLSAQADKAALFRKEIAEVEAGN